MLRHYLRFLSSALPALLLAACAVGPNFHRPAPPPVRGYLPEPLPDATTGSASGPASGAQSFVAGRSITERWWQAFGSASLDGLIQQALGANPTLSAAQASLREALEHAAAQRGAYWPQLQANLAASRQRNGDVLSPTLNSGSPLFNLYTPQLSVSFVPDLLGGNRRQVESLQAQADAARFELDATYITLIDNVIAAAVQAAALREQIQATDHVVALDREILQVLHHSLELGAISEADVDPQETALAQAEATLPPLKQQFEVQRHLLAALTGHLPPDAPQLSLGLDQFTLPSQIPLGLPSTLVERRPDVLAAEAQLHAATAEVGVATANLLPQFTITAGVGSTATLVSELFKSGTGFWSVGGNLSQTLFDGGTLIHTRRATIAAMDAAGATYRFTVLAAFQNVADALTALSADAAVLEASSRAAQAAQSSLTIARSQLRLGSINSLALLLAEQAYEQTQLAWITARMNRLADTAALFQALGGTPFPAATQRSRP